MLILDPRGGAGACDCVQVPKLFHTHGTHGRGNLQRSKHINTGTVSVSLREARVAERVQLQGPDRGRR